jgi:peptide deformylase
MVWKNIGKGRIKMILPVHLYIDPILKQSCLPVEEFSGIDNIVSDMIETMGAYCGIGLAAPQVGLPLNLAVMHLENKTKLIVVANPTNICYNKEWSEELEGCLSAPNISIKIKRPTWVEFEYQKLNGEKDKMRLEGFDCRIFFHEWNHLQGHMITDSIMKL